MIARTFRMAAWLGWQIESNWADPFLFLVYSVTKPLAQALILVAMYGVITRGNFGTPLFACIYLGNAFYIYVGGLVQGISWGIIDDRERYRTLKYIWVAPVDIPTYLIGRAVARFFISSIAVAVTLTVGVVFLKLPLNPLTLQWPLFGAALGLGIVLLAFLGLAVAALTLNVARHNEYIGYTVAGALYLFSGAVFPLTQLPAFLRPLGYALPITWWLELLRRALLGPDARVFAQFATLTDMQVLAGLTAMTVVAAGVSLVLFRLGDRRARENGYIDKVMNY
jgi:ABC-2 type transport system permease protein